jgi:hypothetical protein
MNHYVVELSALIYVETPLDPETLTENLIAQLEELAESADHLLDYELCPFPLPTSNGSLH